LNSFLPFLRWLPLWRQPAIIRADLLAGLTGALVVLPQGVAFASLAGMPPQYGLYAAIVPCIVAALFGSSRLMVTGPANAISLTLLALVSPLAEVGSFKYVELAITLTFMVGVFQLVAGMLRAGTIISRIPDSVIHGFTAGAAVLILVNQAAPALGLSRAAGTTVWSNLANAWVQWHSVAFISAAVSGSTILAIVLAKTTRFRAGAMLIGLACGTAIAKLLTHLHPESPQLNGVAGFAATLPPLTIPNLDHEILRSLIGAALVMTLLALAEATAISRSIAARMQEPFEGNWEIVGQGLANVAGAFFSAYPASGSFNRSSVNVEAGARTPASAIFAALFLATILLFASGLARHLPVAAIAGVLVIVGWNLIDFALIGHALRDDADARGPLILTFLATLQLPLEAALLLGLGYVGLRGAYRFLSGNRANDPK
jgi:sulfate permease, SulP family